MLSPIPNAVKAKAVECRVEWVFAIVFAKKYVVKSLCQNLSPISFWTKRNPSERMVGTIVKFLLEWIKYYFSVN